MFWHYTKLFYSFHWICIMAKVSKNMPQFKRSRFLFLCLNEWPKFRNDLTITKWIPLLLEVVSAQSPHHPYPWAGVDGLCGHSEWVIGLGEFYFDGLLPSTLFQLCSLHYHANSYAVSNETANRIGYGEKGLFELGITPEKTLLWTHGHRGHVYVSRLVWRQAENNFL